MSDPLLPRPVYVTPVAPPPVPPQRRGPGWVAVVLVATIVSLIVGGVAGLGGYIIGSAVDASEPTAPAVTQEARPVVAVEAGDSTIGDIVTKVLEFIPGQKPKLYYGNVSDYLEKKKADMELEAAKANPSAAASRSAGASDADNGVNRKEQRRLEAKAREERATKLKPLKKEFEALESEIAKLEEEKLQLDAKLADPEFFKQGEESSAAMKRYSEIEEGLEKRLGRWAELSEKIEALEKI